MKNCKRLLSLLLAAVLLLGIVPAAAFAAEPAAEVTGDVPAETTAETIPDTTPDTEPSTTPATVPEETTPGTVPETAPDTTAETTAPETMPETTPETTTPETEATTPATVPDTVPATEAAEATEPAETEPEIVELDPSFFQSLILFSAAPRAATGTLKVGNEYSIPVANGYISAGGWHYYQMDTLMVNNVAAFCIQPGVEIPGGASGVTYTQSSSLGSYLTRDQQKAVALALYYGYPSTSYATIPGGTAADPTLGGNPTYWAEAEKLTATQIIVWEICLGYRNATAPYARTSSYLYDKINGNGRNWVNFKNVYNSIASSMAKSSTIPSFSASSASTAPVTTLQYDSASGNFTASVTDTNWSLGYYSANRNHSTGDTVEIPTGIPGVTATFTWGKNVLTITATPEAAASLNGNLVTLRNNTVTDADPSRALLLWVRSGCQSVVQAASVGYSPVPAYFKLDAEELPEGITLEKSVNASDACIQQLQGNHMYTLAGAKYEVRDEAGNVLETLTTDAAGKAASAGTYAVGTVLTVVETAAPAGFLLDTTPHVLTVSSDPAKNVIQVADEPVFDPALSFTKVDKTTTGPQGNSSFQGAVFKWEYFDNTDWSGTPVRTWYFETKANGQAQYNPEWFAVGYASDSLYVKGDGMTGLLLGTLKITEVKAPYGYAAWSKPLYISLTEAGSIPTSESLDLIKDYSTTDWSVYEPNAYYGSIEVQKLDPDTGKTPQGDAPNLKTQYNVINLSEHTVKIGDFPVAQPGEVCFTFWTDDSGYYKSGNIFRAGKYKIVEATPPVGYTLNTEWYQEFTVTDTPQNFPFVAPESALSNTPIKGGVQVVKQDAALGENTTAAAKLDGITFSIYSESDGPVVVDGVTYHKGDAVKTIPLHWNENMQAWTAETAADALPWGSYIMRENPKEAGSIYANDRYFLSGEGFPFGIRVNGEIVTQDTSGNAMIFQNFTFGKITVQKVNEGKEPLAGAKFLLEWSEDGKTWLPVTHTDLGVGVMGGCTSPALDADGCITTGEDGLAVFEGLYTTLQYRLTEVEAPEGYVLLQDRILVGSLVPESDYEASYTIVNNHAFEMPHTGSVSGWLIPAFGTALITLGCCMAAAMVKRKKSY